MTFTRPEAFFLLLLLPVFWRMWRGRRGGRSWKIWQSAGRRMNARRRLALALRITTLGLMILALAGPQALATSEELQVVFVVDRSRSIPGVLQSAIELSLRDASKLMGERDRAGLVVFGETAQLESRPAPLRVYDGQVTSLVGGDLTDIAAGVRLGLTTFPDGVAKRIVLVTDGNENRGSLLETATLAAANGVQIDVVPIRYEYPNEVFVEKVVLPDRVKLGQPFLIRTVVHSTVSGPARLDVFENGLQLELGEGQVALEQGKNVFYTRLHFRDEQHLQGARQGFYVYEARVTPLDATGSPDPLDQPSNNRAIGFTQVEGRPVVLIVDGNTSGGEFLAEALSSQGILTRRIEPLSLPDNIVELQGYDCIVLSNVRVESFTPGQLAMLRSSVRDVGTGLIMIGGEHSFAAGGWLGSPVEEVLPVRMEVKEEKIVPNGALACIMHTCEFQNGNTWAKDITIAAMDVLSPQDWFGVVYYPSGGGNCTWGFKGQMVQLTDKATLRRIIRQNLNPGDMPDFDNAFFVAEGGLARVPATLKHIIVISDGDPTPPSPAVIQRIIKQDVTISAIAIAPHMGGTQVLQNLARVSGGNYYAVSDPRKLPRIFIHEAQVVKKAAVIEKELDVELAGMTEVVHGVVEGGVPKLYGYVAATARDLASVPLTVDDGMPLLAHWRYGLGRTAAFTSDARDLWARDWVNWGKFPQLWAQIVRWCQKSVDDAGYQVRTETEDGRARISVDAVDEEGRFENGLEVQATVVSASGEEVKEISLLQTAPGHYEALVDSDSVGAYLVNLRYRKQVQGEDGVIVDQISGQTAGFSVPYSPEFRQLDANVPLLEQVADLTGGHVLRELGSPVEIPERGHLASNPYHVFLHDLPLAISAVDLWQIFLLIAVVVFVLDIVVRRIVFDPLRLLAPLAVVLPVLRGAQERARAEAEKLAASMRGRPERPTTPAPERPAWLAPDATAADAGRDLLGERKDEKKAAAEDAGAESATDEASSYTNRLLEAKRRARQDRRRK